MSGQGSFPTEADIERAIVFISVGEEDPDHRYYRDIWQYWRGLRAMEHFGVDWSFAYGVIQDSLFGEFGAWPKDPAFAKAHRREIVLALRDVHRSELGLPRLSQAVRDCWEFKPVPLLKHRPMDADGNTIDFACLKPLTEEQVMTGFKRFVDNYPEMHLMTVELNKWIELEDAASGWWTNFRYHVPYGMFNGFPYDGFINDVIDHVFCELYGSISDLDIKTPSLEIYRNRIPIPSIRDS